MLGTLNFRIFFIVTVVAIVLLASNGIIVGQPVSASTENSFEEGWCCHNGRVFPATEEECREHGGHFFPNREEAERHCREERPYPEPGWCCHDGRVFPATEEECREQRGHFFPTREEAERHCREERPHPEQGWCCHNGRVFPATEEECRERRGHFFPNREEAERHCGEERPHPEQGWCCLNGKVFPAPREECAERGGRFFPSKEEAESYCSEGPGQLKIGDLKGPGWEKYIGKTVTIEGIFVRDPLPMLVTDLKIVLVNTPMPKDQYIVLTGGESEEINPKEYGGAKLKVTGIVIPLDDPKNYGKENVGIKVISYELMEMVKRYWTEPVMIHTLPGLREPYRYAILFSGGGDVASNHVRYWNDLKFMYSTLVKKYGFSDKTIAVLYANGKGRDKQMPVHYSATQTNLETVFNLLRKDSTEKDFIFIFTTNHGGGFYKAGYTYFGKIYYNFGGRFDANGDEGAADILVEKNYNMDLNSDGDKFDQVSWDEELCSWGGSIFDDNIRNMFANIKYKKMVIVMEQCFSGGLIRDIGAGRNNMVIMSAAGEYEFSEAMPPAPYNYDEFSYHFTCAINGADPNGKKVNADTNGDKKVSMVEAFNYAKAKDTRSETPLYEDSGDGIPHSGKMPASGEGTLGSKTFLKE